MFIPEMMTRWRDWGLFIIVSFCSCEFFVSSDLLAVERECQQMIWQSDWNIHAFYYSPSMPDMMKRWRDWGLSFTATCCPCEFFASADPSGSWGGVLADDLAVWSVCPSPFPYSGDRSISSLSLPARVSSSRVQCKCNCLSEGWCYYNPSSLPLAVLVSFS